MATLVARRRKDGSVAHRVQWRLAGSGPWQSETFDDKRAAAKFQAQVEAHGHLWPDGWIKGWGYGTPPSFEEEPVGDLLIDVGTAYVRRLTSAGPDTQTRYLNQVKALVRWLTEVKGGVEPTLQNVTSDDDRDWINVRRRAGASPKTIANYHGLLAAIFKSAVGKGLIGRNPCDGVGLPRLDDDTEDDNDKVFLTESEFRLLYDCIDEDSKHLILVAVGTGLRWGELTALKVKDVVLDADVPTLTVRRAWKRNGKGEFAVDQHGRFYLGKPKTRESRRRMTVSPAVVAALDDALQGRSGDELIFRSPQGCRLDQGNWYEGGAEQGYGVGPHPDDERLRATVGHNVACAAGRVRSRGTVNGVIDSRLVRAACTPVGTRSWRHVTRWRVAGDHPCATAGFGPC